MAKKARAMTSEMETASSTKIESAEAAAKELDQLAMGELLKELGVQNTKLNDLEEKIRRMYELNHIAYDG